MENNFQDKELTCECGEKFIWTSGEQEFMEDLRMKGKLDEEQPDGSIRPGRVFPPKRCKACRMKRKKQ